MFASTTKTTVQFKENVMKKSTTLIAVAAFITGNISIANADAPFEPRTATVQFADLDTANTQGAATLYRRIKTAAASVCRDLEPGKQLVGVWAYTDCVQTAMSNAIAKVNRPAVTAYAAARGMPIVNATVRIADNK
jgi:UrcA family protein